MMTNVLHGHALLLLRASPSEPAEENEPWGETGWQEQEQEQEQEQGQEQDDGVVEGALEVHDECVLAPRNEMLYSV